VAAAKLLLDKGANPNVKEGQREQTPLMWAAASSQGPMTRELLAHGAEVDTASATDLMTPLVSKEPRAQPRPPGGMTAMLFASREGCLDCVKALVEKGAKLDLPDPEGVTPLITALFNARFDVAKYLIEKGANIDKWDWWGRSPLYLAVDYNTLPHGGRPDQPSLDATLPIEILPDGTVQQGGNPVARLQLTTFAPGSLAKEGANYFIAAQNAAGTPATGQILQGKIEQSNTGAAESAIRLVGITRQFEMLQKAAGIGNDLSKQAIEQVARVVT